MELRVESGGASLLVGGRVVVGVCCVDNLEGALALNGS